jgi:hypothetical protein
MKLSAALLQLRPGAIWSAPNDCTDATQIIWHDDTEPVTQAELDAKMAEPDLREIKAQRAAAYRNESDPLLFKAQRGEATMEEWQAAVEEIRARYPYPVR